VWPWPRRLPVAETSKQPTFGFGGGSPRALRANWIAVSSIDKKLENW
jgi:hypothetical protein